MTSRVSSIWRRMGEMAGGISAAVVVMRTDGFVLDIADGLDARQQKRLAAGCFKEGFAQAAAATAGRQQDQRLGEDGGILAIARQNPRGQRAGKKWISAGIGAMNNS